MQVIGGWLTTRRNNIGNRQQTSVEPYGISRATHPYWLLARTLALSGDQRGARRQLNEVNQPSKYSSLPHYHIGMAHAALGNKDTAFGCLLESCSAHEMWASFIQIDPKMDTLRNDRRYTDLRRGLSL